MILMNVGTIIHDEYDDDNEEYFRNLRIECKDMLRNMHKSKYFASVRFRINKYEEFIYFLLKHCEEVDRVDSELTHRFKNLQDTLACRERELVLVKNERNVLSHEISKSMLIHKENEI